MLTYPLPVENSAGGLPSLTVLDGLPGSPAAEGSNLVPWQYYVINAPSRNRQVRSPALRRAGRGGAQPAPAPDWSTLHRQRAWRPCAMEKKGGGMPDSHACARRLGVARDFELSRVQAVAKAAAAAAGIAHEKVAGTP